MLLPWKKIRQKICTIVETNINDFSNTKKSVCTKMPLIYEWEDGWVCSSLFPIYLGISTQY